MFRLIFLRASLLRRGTSFPLLYSSSVPLAHGCLHTSWDHALSPLTAATPRSNTPSAGFDRALPSLPTVRTAPLFHLPAAAATAGLSFHPRVLGFKNKNATQEAVSGFQFRDYATHHFLPHKTDTIQQLITYSKVSHPTNPTSPALASASPQLRRISVVFRLRNH